MRRPDQPALPHAMLLFLIGLLLPALALAQAMKKPWDGSGFSPNALEITRLPKMCWSQFDSKFRGTGFELPGGCGGGMNHLCPSYISLNRAKSAIADAGARGYWLNVARDHVEYTIRAIANYPACPLREEVMRLQAEIRGLQGRR